MCTWLRRILVLGSSLGLLFMATGSAAQEPDDAKKTAPPPPRVDSVNDESADTDEGKAIEEEEPAAPSAPQRELKGPDVRLVEAEKRTIYEYRQNGRLVRVKVVPKNGQPYYLVPADPTLHGGDIERSTQLVAHWVLVEF